MSSTMKFMIVAGVGMGIFAKPRAGMIDLDFGFSVEVAAGSVVVCAGSAVGCYP